MSIQWYPGHMHKAIKEMKENLPKMDVVIEVLDARIPFSSENPQINQIRGDKPCIKIMTKCDLADPDLTQAWQAYFEQDRHVKTLALTIEQPDKMRQVLDLCRKIVPSKANNDKPVHAMIMGIPNVGKSTLINTLAGRTIAKTGNEPAVTKGQQQINLRNGILLYDTPGVLWPKVESEFSGYRLATTGAIKETAMSNDDVAFFAANYLLPSYPDALRTRYQLEELPNTEIEFFETIGAKRGCMVSGGRVDLERICKIFLTEYRGGTLGRITLETPEMIEKEIVIVAEQIAEQQAKKEARKLARQAKKRKRR
ncbi:MAG: ribosome biogenesis GTPase YlqF [Kangiellaceae bacterium]|nr:ribosome biogenesis GTPase YlqF [Kangiellaceae bacterium]|tara:strand:- start:214 stop:1146 length:933 start_codon:yes stop_codon:yes gene_type:complete